MSKNSIPPVTTRNSMFGDPTEDRYRATLRYLGAVAHDEAIAGPHAAAPSTGPQFVRDVMQDGVVAAHEGAAFKEIVASLARNRIGAVPVVDAEHRVVGVVSEADLLARVADGHVQSPRGHLLTARTERRAKVHGATASDLMTRPAVVTTPDALITTAARSAAINRVRHLPVVDKDGRLVGIVARGDLLRPFLRGDEEIRADIVGNVVSGTFVLNTRNVDVHVTEGVVQLSGQVERKSLRTALVDAIGRVCGVVDVDPSRLTYAVDDTIVAAPAHTIY